MTDGTFRPAFRAESVRLLPRLQSTDEYYVMQRSAVRRRRKPPLTKLPVRGTTAPQPPTLAQHRQQPRCV